jgi:hypothetical protein
VRTVEYEPSAYSSSRFARALTDDAERCVRGLTGRGTLDDIYSCYGGADEYEEREEGRQMAEEPTTDQLYEWLHGQTGSDPLEDGGKEFGEDDPRRYSRGRTSAQYAVGGREEEVMFEQTADLLGIAPEDRL